MFPRLSVDPFPERTVPALLVASARRHGRRRFLRVLDPERSPEGEAVGTRELTFEAFSEGVGRAVACLQEVGVAAGERVLLLAENSPEWQMVALAGQVLRAEPAALFASLGAEPAEGIARRARPRVIFVSGSAQWSKLAPAAADLVRDGLTAVLSPEPLHAATLPTGLRVVPLATALGESAPGKSLEELAALAERVGEEDPFLLLFTSGTTGRPKGVRLPQRSILRALASAQAAVDLSGADVGLQLLPFGHVAGHDQFIMALGQGHELIMIARREELDRALALGPTYLFSVPLIYERIRAAVEEKLARLPAPLRAAARAALAAAGRHRVDGSPRWRDRLGARLADRLVGRAVRARLGGRVRGIYAGGAPSSPALFRFFESLGLPFVELYGMTETAGVISSNLSSGPRCAGSVGRISPDHEVRLTADGELLLRGPILFSGFLEPEDGLGAWTEDGFFRTGDVASLDEGGFLRIEGRKKSLIVLSTGKKVLPEPVELAIAAVPPFTGAVLLGEGMPFVAVAVFVRREELARLGAGGNDPAVELLARAREALDAFSEYEKPKRLLVIPGEPAEHPALLTPTLKLRREALLSSLGPSVAGLFDSA